MMPLLLAQVDLTAAVLFYVLAILTAGSAIAVVVSRNIVRNALYLLFTLASVAGLYVLLSAEFLAATQLVVYVGGTLILIIFGVMLTSKTAYGRLQPRKWEVALAGLLGVLLLTALVASVWFAMAHKQFADRPLEPIDRYPVARLGQALLGDYLVPFEVVSVLLLVVMIGAAYLAKARRKPGSTGN